MLRRTIFICVFLRLSVGASASDLALAPAEELLRVYSELRQLRAGDQWAAAENVAWKRDSATFKFESGRLSFAAPVGGRVVGAVFVGRGTFVLEPPTPVAQQQIARFTKSPKLEDVFNEAIFFFTDDSWAELQKLVTVQSGGVDTTAASKLASAQRQYAESFNDWIDNQIKGNFAMRNLAARMLADLTDPTSRGFFLADFKGERSGDLLFHISWNRDSLLMPGTSNDEEVTLLHYNLGDYYEWWSGFHLREEYARTPHPEHRRLLAHCRQERIEAQVGKD